MSQLLIILLLALSIVSSIQTVNALSTHYELNERYYYPGDAGKLTLVTRNDELGDLYVFQAYMDIAGIGRFEWDATGLEKATSLPPDIDAYLLRKGETINIEIPFRIPVDAKPGEYRYTWAIVAHPSPIGHQEYSKSDSLRVIATGESPPSQSQFPLPLVLIAIPILLLAVVVSKWKKKKETRIFF